MNTKIYKAVHDLAEQLLAAAQQENEPLFMRLYDQLNSLCIDNEASDKDHPVQWETLADFTEELEEAMSLYGKAFAKAQAMDAKDYMSSIAYSKALLHVELGQVDTAIELLKGAKADSKKLDDKELKCEIHDLLVSLVDTQ